MVFDRKFKFQIITTGGTEAINAFVQFFFVFSLPFFISKSDLGLFFSFKAVIASLLVLFRFAFDIALTRYLGYFSGNSEKQKQIFSSIIILFSISSVVSILLLFIGYNFIIGKFLDNNFILFVYLVITLFLHGIYRICYCFYQGTLRIKKANILSLTVYAGGHFIILLLLYFKVILSLESIILCSSLIFVFALIPFVSIISKNFVFDFEFREILEYSIPRIPHMVLSGFLMSANVILAKYFFSNEAAGDLGITTRLFQIIGMFAYSFNMILLPKVSALIGKGLENQLKNSMEKYIDLVIYLGTVGSFLFFAITPKLLKFLPESYETAEIVLQIFAFAILPYTIYMMLRSVIHGIDKKPIQLYIDLTSLFVLMTVFYVLNNFQKNPLVLISVSMTASILTSGIFSLIYMMKKLKIETFFKKWIFHTLFIFALSLLSLKSFILALFLFSVMEIPSLIHYLKRSR